MKKSLLAKAACFVAGLLLLSFSGITQTLNPASISTDGTVTSIIQDSATIYIGGSFNQVGYKASGIAKLNSNARTAFEFPSVNGYVYEACPDGNGGWYVGGGFSVQGKNNLIHILSNNTIDASFTPDPNAPVSALYLDGSTLYVGGSFTQISGQSQNYLAALDATTGTWQSWNPNPDGVINSITKDGSNLYVAGTFSNIGGRPQGAFAIIDIATGTATPSITAFGGVNCIEQDASNIYLGGNFQNGGYWTGTGALLNTGNDLPDFNAPLINGGQVFTSIPDGSGGWFVGGNFSIQGLSNLVHILSNNSIDISFAPNPNSQVSALYLDGTNLYVGGYFTQISGNSQSYLAKINSTTGVIQSWNPNPDNGVVSITKDGSNIYIAGGFSNIGNRPQGAFAVIDETTGLSTPSISAFGTINCIEQDATNIYLGGSFNNVGFWTGTSALLNTGNDSPDFNLPLINGGQVYSSISDGSGGWYVGGNFSVQGLSYLIHFLSNNTIDLSFAPNPNSVVSALYLDGTTLYVGGSFTQISGQSQNYLAAINATTGILQSWNPNSDGGVSAINKNGTNLYIAGGFTNIGGRAQYAFAIIDETTGLASPSVSAFGNANCVEQDATNVYIGGGFNNAVGYWTGSGALLNTSGDLPDFNLPLINGGQVFTSVPDGNGGWYVGGINFSIQGLSNLVHILPNNTVDLGFAPNPNQQVNSLYLDGTTLYVGGYFTQISGNAQNYLAAIDATTGVLQSWNPNPDGGINSIIKSGTNIYVGGGFTTIGGQSRNNIASINETTGNATAWNPDANSTVNTLELNGTEIIAGGTFTSIGGQLRNYLAALNITTGNASAWDPSPNSTVNSISLNGANAYVGGSFTTIGGQPRNNIAEINLTTGNATTWNPTANANVASVKLIGTTIYAGGDFTTIGGQSRNYLAALNNSTGNATTWNPQPNSVAYCLAVNGTSIFAGGNFSVFKSEIRNNFFAVNKSTGLITTLDPNPVGSVNSIALNGANAYFAGSFNSIGGQSRNSIAEINLTTGNATTWNPNSNGNVASVKLIGTTIYAGGDFTAIGGQNRNYIAALNNTTGNATTWNPQANSSVYTISVNGTSILAGGAFTHFKAEARNNFFAINKSSGLVTALNPNPTSSINSIALNGSNAYIAGSFTNIGGQPRNNIAEINLTTGNATSWNPNANTNVASVKLIGTTIYAGGDFTTIGGQSRNYIAALNNTNGNATIWNPQANSSVYSLSVNGTAIYAGGAFTYLKAELRNYFLAISKSTGLIASLNPNPSSTINSIALNTTNAYVGGSFTNIGGQPRNNIAEINLTTGNATTWNPNANSNVASVKLIGTTIYAGGDFTTVGGQSRNYLAALNNSNGNALAWNPQPNQSVFKVYQDGSDVVATGYFSFMNSEQRHGLLAVSKASSLITSWDPVGASSASITSMVSVGSNIYVGGSFSTIGGQPRNNIACLNKGNNSATTWNPNSDNLVTTLSHRNNTIYAGGQFANIGGQARNFLAALNTGNNNATAWNPNPNGGINAIRVSDTVLYVAGDYTTIDGQNRNRLSAFNLLNSAITNWNPDVNGSVYDMHLTASNVYVAGSFNSVSGQTRNNVACISKASGTPNNWHPDLNGPAYSIYSKGNNVFVGGVFTTGGGQTCSNFVRINANTSLPFLFFPQVNSTITNLSVFDSLLYMGGSFTDIDGYTFGGYASYSFPEGFFKPRIDFYTPDKGGNNGSVLLSIYGNGFEDGTQVKLTKTGSPDLIIPDSSIKIIDGIQMACALYLTDVDTGYWNIVVSIPNDTTIQILNGFLIQTGQLPDIQVDIVGPSLFRINQWQNYQIAVTNYGNTSALAVPIFIAVSSNVEIGYNLGNLIYVPSDSLSYDTIPPYVIVDSLFTNSTDSFYLFPLVISNINPNQTIFYSIKVKALVSSQIQIQAWAGRSFTSNDSTIYFRMMSGSPCTDDLAKVQCITNAMFTAIGFIPGASCVASSLSGFLNTLLGGACKLPAQEQTTSLVGSISEIILSCIPGANIAVALQKAAKIVGYLSNGNLIYECVKSFQDKDGKKDSIPAVAVAAIDPNEKYGPLGSGNSNYLNTNYNIPYEIHFENADSATAAAQTVVVIDTLDQNVFDISTFQLGFISIGDSIIPLPPGLKTYQTDIDLRPSNNIIAHIEGGLNMSTGIATWTFTSLDPLTLLPTTNPLDGFLPPNVNEPEGEGAIFYSIKAWDTVSYNTILKNKAYIFFDFNPPIVTNEWTNTVDNIKPQSQVAALPPVQYNDTTIQISWAGTDVGSGVRTYSIYYSTNGGTYQPWILNTILLDSIFTGNFDSTYTFYSIATDSVGNIEDPPVGYDAITSFVVGIKDINAPSNIYLSLYPNPNNGNFTVEIKGVIQNEKVDMLVKDMLGKVVHEEQLHLKTGVNKFEINAAELSQGLYLMDFSLSNYTYRKKFVKK